MPIWYSSFYLNRLSPSSSLPQLPVRILGLMLTCSSGVCIKGLIRHFSSEHLHSRYNSHVRVCWVVPHVFPTMIEPFQAIINSVLGFSAWFLLRSDIDTWYDVHQTFQHLHKIPAFNIHRNNIFVSLLKYLLLWNFSHPGHFGLLQVGRQMNSSFTTSSNFTVKLRFSGPIHLHSNPPPLYFFHFVLDRSSPLYF